MNDLFKLILGVLASLLKSRARLEAEILILRHREKVPRNWADLCDSVTDNFRVINPKDFRVVT